MASSILPGDRRWTSARKGMTVLGKVPKPINLPSQRLENNGLDPNVEIVPKGTLTWGSKSCSTTPNAWASSTLSSPKTDGGTGSPSHPSGRPSSGGSGTRPSTAGSERSQDPSPSAWGPSSRPSSASGILPSSQVHTVSSRPHSAETRPGSSQLSRFAEHQGEPQVAWGPSRTSERLGVSSSKVDSFTLNSGDFPTLGCEKDSISNVQRGNSSHGRPTSSCGADSILKEQQETHGNEEFVETNLDNVNVNGLKPDKNLFSDNRSNTKWQNEPSQAQPFTHINMPPHQFDSWHGPPAQPHDGSWGRGAPGGPYRPPAPPGGYAVDPFMYYPHHFPPNNEGVVRPGAGQDGFNPANGDQYHPQMSGNSFIIPSPVIPARPGAFHAPVPYDGYYPPQMAFVGAATRPGFYNQFQNPNGNISHGLHGRSGGHSMQVDKQHMPPDRAHSIHQGPYKVLLKPHDGSENVHPQEKRGLLSHPLQHGKESEAVGVKQEPEQPAVRKKINCSESAKSEPVRQVIPQQIGEEIIFSDHTTIVSQENLSKTSDSILSSKPEVLASEIDQQHYPVTRKNAALFEKIEGLNNKVRNSENQNDARSYEQEKTKQSKAANTHYEDITKFSDVGSSENVSGISGTGMVLSSGLRDSNASQNHQLSSNAKVGEIDPSDSQRKVCSGGNRVNNYGKPRSDYQIQDERTENSFRKELPVAHTGVINGNAARVGRSGFHTSKRGVIKDLHSAKGLESETFQRESVDYENQRAKMREIAAQRAKQLQKEEEERTRELKAKALAKLEELNRRSTTQNSKETHDSALSSDKSEEFGSVTAAEIDDVKTDASGVALVENSCISLQASDSESKFFEVSSSLPMTTALSTSEIFSQEPSNLSVPSLSSEQETDRLAHRTSPHSHDSSNSRHRLVGYRQKQKFAVHNLDGIKNVSDNSIEKASDDKPSTAKSGGIVTDHVEVGTPASNEKMIHCEHPSAQQKKKNNRNAKNKIKADEIPLTSTVTSSLQSAVNLESYTDDSSKAHTSVSEGIATRSSTETGESRGSCHTHHPGSCESQGPSSATITSSESGLSKVSHESHGRANCQSKSQVARRPRNQQVRLTDKVHRNETSIWAPVKASNRSEQSEESSMGGMKETDTHSTLKNEHDTHMATRTKRAEIERYVPKPVAKELLQQEILQQCSSFNQSPPVDIPGKSNPGNKNSVVSEGSTSVRAESVVDNKMIEDGKSSRRSRNASWRQRNLSDSTSNIDAVTSDVAKPSNIISNQCLATKLGNSPDEQMKCGDLEGSKSLLPMPTESPPLSEVIRDQGIASRQRRQHAKIQKPVGNSYAPQFCDSNDPATARLDSNEVDDQSVVRTENKNPTGEYTRTQWKPKSHPRSHGEQQDNISEGTKGTFISGSDKEFTSQLAEHIPLHNVCKGPVAAKGDAMQQSSGVNNSDAKPDIKASSNANMSKDHPNRGIQDVSSYTELAPVTAGLQQEQGSHTAGRHGHHIGHYSRGREANYRSRDFGQDSRRQQYVHADKRRNHSHLEYQPVGGSYNKPGNMVESNSEGSNTSESQHVPGQSYKEKGHNQTRRNGNFFRRSGNAAVVHVGDSQSHGE